MNKHTRVQQEIDYARAIYMERYKLLPKKQREELIKRKLEAIALARTGEKGLKG